jgi:hypothetical protein
MPAEVLNLYRRHGSDCAHKAKGRRWTKCQCPVWVQGTLRNEPVRTSLDTRSWSTAQQRLKALESGGAAPVAVKLLADACAEFGAAQECGPETRRKNAMRLRMLTEYATSTGLLRVDQWDLVALDGYKQHRRESLDLLAWSKELQFFRHLWRWFVAREYTTANPAEKMAVPKRIQSRERVPYTSEQVTAILAACDRVGQSVYERLRARAAVLLARTYGLRV